MSSLAVAATALPAQQSARKPDPQPKHGADSVQRARRLAEAAKIDVKDKHNLLSQTRITPTRAKEIALIRVPGQISSAELSKNGTRIVYDIKLLPTDKKTYSGVTIDAVTGEVIGVKQFGGVRGAAGYARESADRKKNKSDTKKAADAKKPPV
jgi:uncharacterized membrane protein YkoI